MSRARGYPSFWQPLNPVLSWKPLAHSVCGPSEEQNGCFSWGPSTSSSGSRLCPHDLAYFLAISRSCDLWHLSLGKIHLLEKNLSPVVLNFLGDLPSLSPVSGALVAAEPLV